MSVTVGVVANPASGRDIRRLVTSASVFDNAEKANMVARLVAGLGAVGVDRVLLMPAASSLATPLERQLRRAAADTGRPGPGVEWLDTGLTDTAEDTVRAAEALRDLGVAGIAVLGGDGTHRLVARHCGDVPLLALSTGTNNAFPQMREATTAGLALGLVATGRLPHREGCRRYDALRVGADGHPDGDLALVDVAVSRERFVGSRAVWSPDAVSEVFTAFAEPGTVGLSAVAGLLQPLARGGGAGLHVVLAPPDQASVVVTAPVAPGVLAPMGIRSVSRLQPGVPVPIRPGTGALALDGEREIERSGTEHYTVRLVRGPLVVDVDRTLAEAAARGLLHRRVPTTP